MYSGQGYASFMQFTPCDLWSILKGRTLWVAGDSQSQASDLCRNAMGSARAGLELLLDMSQWCCHRSAAGPAAC